MVSTWSTSRPATTAVTTGCTQRPELVNDNRGPAQLDIDTATNTVYAADQGNPNAESSSATTVTVIDGNTCDGKDHSGCGARPADGHRRQRGLGRRRRPDQRHRLRRRLQTAPSR